MNNRNEPTRVPPQAGNQANCIDLGIITPGLKESVINWSLDTKRTWTPSKIEWTGIVDKHGDKVYRKTGASDHKAIEVELKVSIVVPRRSGNIRIIDYNSKDGWTRYKTLSNKYASDIRTISKTFKDKN